MGTMGQKWGLSLLCLLLTACLLGGCGAKGPDSWQEQYDLGVQYLDEGSHEEAIQAFTAAIEMDSQAAQAYVGRGQAYMGSGETEENLSAARSDYEAALDLDDTLPEAWLGLADVYVLRGNPEKAQSLLEEARDKTGENQAVMDRLDELVQAFKPEEETPQPDQSQPEEPQPGENQPEENQPDGSQPGNPPGGQESPGEAVDVQGQFALFLENRGYESCLSDWSYGAPGEYALLDLNGDGVEELILSGGDGVMEFFSLAVFRLDPQSGQITPVQIYSPNFDGSIVGQYFSMLEYSSRHQALVFSELRNSYMYGESGYYVLRGNRLEVEFSVGYEGSTDGESDEFSYYLSRDGELETLTQEQYEPYQEGIQMVRFQPLPSSGSGA